MGSRALFVLKTASPKHSFVFNRGLKTLDFGLNSSRLLFHRRSDRNNHRIARNFSSATPANSSLPSPDVPRLAETARISLTANEVEEFAPKIRQVIDWFGQLQAVDLNSVEPAIRANTEGETLREDIPETFQNRDAMIGSVPSYEEPYIKVPKVLNKE